MADLEGVQPNDPNTEYDLLGILLKTSLSEITVKIAYEQELSTEDFYAEKHKAIWSAMAELYEAKKAIALPYIDKIIEQNSESQFFVEHGGSYKYMMVCIDSCVFDGANNVDTISAIVKAYIERLREDNIKRKCLKLGKMSIQKLITLEQLRDQLQEITEMLNTSEAQQETSQLLQHINPFPQTHNEIFNEYLDIHKDKTEIPESYLFFSLLACISMMLGHKVYVQWGDQKIYTNIYAMLVGRSAMDRKSSAIEKCRGLISKVASHTNIINGLASWEGLVNAMYQDPSELYSDGIKPNYAIACLDEMDGLIQKARNEAVSNLFPNLCLLYDCPENIAINTKSKPLKVKYPYFSILAGIQPAVIAEAFNAKDAHSGLIGRFMYVYDQVKQSIPIPLQTDQIRVNSLVKELHQVIPEQEIKFMLADNVKDMWISFYNSYRFKFQDNAILSTLNQRLQNHVLKLSTVFAVLDQEREIQEEHLKDAIAIGNWLMENNRLLFADLGLTEYEKVTDKVIGMLKEKSMTKRQLQQRFGNKLTSVLLKVLKDQAEAQVLREEKKNKRSITYHYISKV